MKLMNKNIIILSLLLTSILFGSKETTVEAMSTYEKQYEALMNNVVNSQTPGYKAHVTSVKSINGSLTVKAGNSLRNGNKVFSGNKFHFAIEGEGFFMVNGPDGPLLTRDGRFHLRPDLRLGTLSGNFPVQGEDGEIIFNVDSSGSVDFSSSESGLLVQNGVEIGRFLLVRCDKVESINGIFFKPLSTVIPVESPRVLQQYYETSNVEITKELIKMPMVTKKYDANSKVLQILKNAQKTGLEMGRSQ